MEKLQLRWFTDLFTLDILLLKTPNRMKSDQTQGLISEHTSSKICKGEEKIQGPASCIPGLLH